MSREKFKVGQLVRHRSWSYGFGLVIGFDHDGDPTIAWNSGETSSEWYSHVLIVSDIS